MTSSRLPRLSASVPEMVPVPRRSPVRSGHPVILWCATSCGNENSRLLDDVFDSVCVAPHGVVSETERSMLYTLYCSFSCRYGCSGISVVRGSGSARKGSRASIRTTHGEIEVANDLDVKGPSGTYSQPWISRAVRGGKRVS